MGGFVVAQLAAPHLGKINNPKQICLPASLRTRITDCEA